MTENTHLFFLSHIVKEKNQYQAGERRCPFCNRDELSEILDQEGCILLVKNKFPTLTDTLQTVLIETDDCDGDITTYDADHMQKVITFGINHWLEMEQSGAFQSVVFFKNHGPLSGGTVRHAHMQIVGLKNIDYRKNLTDEMFEGIEIYREGDCIVNLSTKPNACPSEFNIITTPRQDRFLADNIQKVVRYILNHYVRCDSYNLFFYQWNASVICKIVPRYVTSPFLIGFSIPQITNQLKAIAAEIRAIHYSG